MLHRSSSSWFFVWLPILWLLSAYLAESVLKKRGARAFNKVHIVFIVVLSALAFFSFFAVALMPLGRWGS
jgi:hypothetical protein